MYREQIRSKVDIIWNILILIAFYEQPYMQVKCKNNGISGFFTRQSANEKLKNEF